MSKAVYGDWILSSSPAKIAEYFKVNGLLSPIVVNTVGILDPKKSQSQIEKVNVDFPLKLLDAIEPCNGRLATFGTILEEFPDLCEFNPYLASKLKLSNALRATESNVASNFVHFRLHTWYGGLHLQPHMFLGEMINAINSNEVFHMSSGKQLREYHHIEDDVDCIIQLLENNMGGILQINHGDARPISEIAQNIFRYFDKESLLDIDYSSEPPGENLLTRFQPFKLSSSITFRPIFPNLTSYLERFANYDKK